MIFDYFRKRREAKAAKIREAETKAIEARKAEILARSKAREIVRSHGIRNGRMSTSRPSDTSNITPVSPYTDIMPSIDVPIEKTSFTGGGGAFGGAGASGSWSDSSSYSSSDSSSYSSSDSGSSSSSFD